MYSLLYTVISIEYSIAIASCCHRCCCCFVQFSDVVLLLFFLCLFTLPVLIYFVFVWCLSINICAIYSYVYYMRLYCSALLLCVMMMMLFIYIISFFVSFPYFVNVFCECVRTRVSARKNLLRSQVYQRLLVYCVFQSDTHKYDVFCLKWLFKVKRWKSLLPVSPILIWKILEIISVRMRNRSVGSLNFFELHSSFK